MLNASKTHLSDILVANEDDFRSGGVDFTLCRVMSHPAGFQYRE